MSILILKNQNLRQIGRVVQDLFKIGHTNITTQSLNSWSKKKKVFILKQIKFVFSPLTLS